MTDGPRARARKAGARIRRLRLRIPLTQVELADLLGVHALTISRWERGVLKPSTYQYAFLSTYARAGTDPTASAEAATLLAMKDVPGAMYVLLRAALDPIKED